MGPSKAAAPPADKEESNKEGGIARTGPCDARDTPGELLMEIC
ncbi:hypothetical protein [Nonomuraea sp. B5E05]